MQQLWDLTQPPHEAVSCAVSKWANVVPGHRIAYTCMSAEHNAECAGAPDRPLGLTAASAP